MVDLKDARWSVTEFGLEAVNPDFEPYRIPLSELLEVDSEGFISLYVCPMCVSQQVGVDIEAFLDAWRRAVKVHDRFLPKVDQKIFAESLHQARSNAERLRKERWNRANHTWADLPAPAEAPSIPSMKAPEPKAAEPPQLPAREPRDPEF
jgi:hypothetical protein